MSKVTGPSSEQPAGAGANLRPETAAPQSPPPASPQVGGAGGQTPAATAPQGADVSGPTPPADGPAAGQTWTPPSGGGQKPNPQQGGNGNWKAQQNQGQAWTPPQGGGGNWKAQQQGGSPPQAGGQTWTPPQKPAPGTAGGGAAPAGAPNTVTQTAPGVVLPEDTPRPAVGPARMRRRHYGVLNSFVAMVLLPFVLITSYLWVVANDQYASTVGFTVRQEEAPSASAVAGGLASMLGVSSGGSNTRVLYEYIRSPALVARIQEKLDLRAHYSPSWPMDALYSIWPDATIEELTRFWLRMVSISFDEASGLMAIEVRALTPEMATRISSLVVSESQEMINGLNASARLDATRYATEDLDEAVRRLREAREALSSFRASTQIVDPAADIQGRMGILNSLQAQLAQTLVDLDLISEQVSDPQDPRRRQLERRIGVIRARIEEERRSLGGNAVNSGPNTDYPELLARFEGLAVDVQVAEATYRTAQAAFDMARAKAERQSLYLATYISPTSAEKSEYPSRWLLMAMSALFLTLLWSIVVLIYYGLRDRS